MFEENESELVWIFFEDEWVGARLEIYCYKNPEYN